MSALVVVFVLFGPSLTGNFTLDDHSVIEKGLQQKSFWENVFEVWVSPWHPGGQWAGNYRPLKSLSFEFNLLFSASPIGFRIVNILLYALNILFIFRVVRKISSERVAYITSLIFLLLPIHSEVVMSVVGRVYLLGTLFSLFSIYYFLDRRYWLSAGNFLLALLSGDAFISLILVFGGFLLVEKKIFALALKEGRYYLFILPTYFLFRFLGLGKYAFGGYGFINPIIGPLAFISFKDRVFTGLNHLYLYLRKTVYPVDLSPDYSFNQIPAVSNILVSWRSLIGLAFLIFLIFLFFKSKRKDIKLAVILFLAPFIVISNVFFVSTGTMAERWWYFPSWGLVLLIALGLENLILKFKILNLKFLYTLGIIILLLYSYVIFQQNKVWLNDQNLFIRAAEKSPNSVWARTNLAEGFFLSGNIDKAKEEIKAALKISNEYPLTLYVSGQIYWKEGLFGQAEDAFQKALGFDTRGSNKRSLYRSLALLSLDIGNNKQALMYMQEAVKWPPAGDLDKILKIDETLLKKMEEYSDRNINSYTRAEINELVQIIKILRGF